MEANDEMSRRIETSFSFTRSFSLQVSGIRFNCLYPDGVILDPRKHDIRDLKTRDAFFSAIDTFRKVALVYRLQDVLECIHPSEELDDSERSAIAKLYQDAISQDVIEVPQETRDAVNSIVSFGRLPGIKTEPKIAKPARKFPGYVYLIKSETGHYKIGRTNNPDNRMRAFGIKLPFRVHYEHLIKSKDMCALETELHQRFAQKRLDGEWFNLSDEDVAYIKSLQGDL